MRDLLNGLELVELMAGPASGMHGKHGSGTGMLMSALRHIRTDVPFIAKRRVVHGGRHSTTDDTVVCARGPTRTAVYTS